MMKILPLILAVITALLPFVLQKTGLSEKYGFKMKMLCAFMYLATGILSATALYRVTVYSLMILGALCLGVLGDFFLEYKSKSLFPIGAAFFALGHIVYSVTFLCTGNYKAFSDIWAVAAITLILTAAVLIFAKIRLRLVGKKKLILAYAPVLIFAFACTLVSAVISLKAGNLSFGLCLIFAGVLFLASDIMIGMGKGGIDRPKILHNAVSYTYFTAQALLALSIYFQ